MKKDFNRCSSHGHHGSQCLELVQHAHSRGSVYMAVFLSLSLSHPLSLFFLLSLSLSLTLSPLSLSSLCRCFSLSPLSLSFSFSVVQLDLMIAFLCLSCIYCIVLRLCVVILYCIVLYWPLREAGNFWCLPLSGISGLCLIPLFCISSFVILPGPVALSVFRQYPFPWYRGFPREENFEPKKN